jgi:Flp pilus assembly protein TadG
MRSVLGQRHQEKNARGAVLPMVGVLLIVFLGIAALAIDIGYRNTTKNELQNVADAAALAGAGYLGSVYASQAYKNLTQSQSQNYIFNRSEIVDVVQAAGLANLAAGVNISINDDDIIIGNWDPDTLSVNPATLVIPDAVQVITRRDD